MATVMNEMGVQGKRYSATAAALHWLSAAMIVGQLWTGYMFHQFLERGTDERGAMFEAHRTLGVAILLVALIRLGHRLMRPAPVFPDDHPAWERALAVWGHRLLYVFMIGLPLGGLIAISDRGGPIELAFGIQIPAIPGVSKALSDVAGEAHSALAAAFMVLIIVHVLAALRHHGDRHSSARGRMWPSR